MARRVKGVEATKLLSKVAPTTYWCSRCRSPVVKGPRCPSCGAPLRRIYATQPRDLRPAFPRDVEVARRALEESYGKRVASKLMPYDGLYLLNKIQYFDAADEVVAGGYVVGVRYYDLFESRWRFRVTRFGAAIILAESLPGYGRVREKLREGRVLEKRDFYELVEPDGDAEWIAVEDPEGRQGVAKRVAGGRYRVASTWWRLHLEERIRGSSFQRAVEVNKPVLEDMEREALEFLGRELKSRQGRPVAMLSGGKDSTVAAYLAVEAGVRDVVFVDTGLEHPETLECISRLEDVLGVGVRVLSAGGAFWRHVERMGPPARDYRWCTRLVKLAVMSRGLREMGFDRVISITGQRAVESTARAQAGRVSPTGPPNPEGVMLAPVYEWSSLAEHLYIALRGLPLHPLYPEGFERIGCFMCPISRLAELKVVEEMHPELWGRWRRFLERYASKHGLPREWVEYGLWRWRYKLPGDLAVSLSKRGLEPSRLLERALGTPVSVDAASEPPEVLLLELPSISLEELAALAKALGYQAEEREGALKLSKTEDGEEMVVEVDARPAARALKGGKGALFDAMSLAYMLAHCLGEDCRLCERICPSRAVRAETGRPRLNPSKCSSCKRCVMICPAVMRALGALRAAERAMP